MQTQQNPGKTDSKTGVIPYIQQMSESLKGFSQGCSRNQVHTAYFMSEDHPDLVELLKPKAK